MNFIDRIIEEHNESGRFNGKVHTRFPPEPNGYLHLGHIKAICINFDTAKKFNGLTNLRFDDTNPTTENTDYVNSIKEDVKWLGYDWEDREYYTSDYFDKLYEYAVALIKKGKAYVDFTKPEDMEYERTHNIENIYRSTSIDTNLIEFDKMKSYVYPDGTCALRLKIDMKSPNPLMKDPIIYRIKHATHHRTDDKWCIYPMYDWAHGISDSLEGITHSLCSLEFDIHRELYDWCLRELGIHMPQQIEFSRLNVNYTITSKRKIKELIDLNIINGWNDPRVHTISGMRRRGYTADAIKKFIYGVGITKNNVNIDLSTLENYIREDLNKISYRVMAVLDPIKLIITNYPEDIVEYMDIENNPEDVSYGSRSVPFSHELYIERGDFSIDPPKKWRRLAVGRDVRFKGAYILHCTGYNVDTDGNVDEVYCTYYEKSKSGNDVSNIKSMGTLHWVSVMHGINAEVRLYDNLFTDPNPFSRRENYRDKNGKKRKRAVDYKRYINKESLKVVNAIVEPSLLDAKRDRKYQFIRHGYFCVDEDNDKLVFNKTISLRDTWRK